MPASLESLDALLARQRAAFRADPHPGPAVRRDRLERLLLLADRHEAAFIQAIDADFGGRSAHETRLAELLVVRAGIRHALRHLRRWMRVRRMPTAPYFRPGRNRLMPQPLGVVGIIAPWNYPFQLSIGPAVAALAAGNRVLVKPSELAPRFAAALQEAVAAHFAPDELAVVQGGAEFADAFARLPLDHLFFTGSPAVGRLVARAAAERLTPVTLELGGKSPAILAPDCDLADAARRIAFGKLLNAGQTCVAPDYLLVPAGRADAVAAALADAIGRLYPGLPATPDYSAILGERHYARLAGLVEDARAHGARVLQPGWPERTDGAAARKFPPTLVLDAPPQARLMREEIFGPILPILEYRNPQEAIDRINAGEWEARPLLVRPGPGTARPRAALDPRRRRLRQRLPVATGPGSAALRRRGRERLRGLPRPLGIRPIQPPEAGLPPEPPRRRPPVPSPLRQDFRGAAGPAQEDRLNPRSTPWRHSTT